ncbi:MAG TPA: transglutaminase family protein [Caulobacterales bacterium]|nr:transglutaminase family protein [Caulobacterales bacterium]
MIYDIRLVTLSTYDDYVPFARHVLRLSPMNTTRQSVLSSSLSVEPASSELLPGRDFFGNRTVGVVCSEPHHSFIARASARVEVAAPAPIGATPPWEEVAGLALAVRDLSPEAPAHFLFPSRVAPLSDAIRAYAEQSFPPGRPIAEAVTDLMRRIHADFAYDGDATNVSTLPEEAFALKRGVCQDFAHVMIAGLRGLGVPAAYVSGFLRTLPPPGEARREGADAMHAWVMAWCGPAAGWFAVDPTNALVVGEEHVVAAIGRDYADVAPIDGVIFTAGAQRAVEVAVDMAPAA